MHDHPIVENMERTGYPTRGPHKVPICPICEEQCDTVYRNADGEIFACDNCVKTQDAWEVEDIQKPEV